MSFLWYFPSNTFVAIPIIKKMSSDSVVKPCYRNEFHDTRGGIEDRCGFWSCLLKLVFFFFLLYFLVWEGNGNNDDGSVQSRFLS